jgi:inner membrane protein
LDNLTHTLIGVLVGETIARTTRATHQGLEPQQRRNLLVTMMGVGSNLPDLDFVQSAISGGKIDYLLQHRGYTHTVIGGLLIAALLFLVSEAWCRWRRWSPSVTDRLQFMGIAVLALLLHVAMDFANNYGVHPFWPFYNGWLYGDTIFIWEPLLWTAAAPLVFALRTVTARVLVAALLATAVAVCIGSGLVPWQFCTVMIVLSLLMLMVGRNLAPRPAVVVGICVWLAITALFAVARSSVERQARALISRQLPHSTVLEYVLTPMPANPVCWDVLLPMSEADLYTVRRAMWSLMPSLLRADECPGRDLLSNITAPLVAVAAENTASTYWYGEIAMARDQFSRLSESSCDVAAFMQFARVPWALHRERGWIVGDLRYDREPEAGFAELEIGSNPCPASLPPWLPPRSDLLGESTR